MRSRGLSRVHFGRVITLLPARGFAISAESAGSTGGRISKKFPKKQYLSGPQGPHFFACLMAPCGTISAVTTITAIYHRAWFNALLFNTFGKISMKRYSLLITVAAILATSGTAVASEIYKWTDADGNVHYEDRPGSGAAVERLAIVSRNTDNSAVQARVSADRKARAAAAQVASEAPPEMSKADLQAEQQKRQEQCQMYRDRLEAFLRSQRLYREDEAGERQYLDEDEIMAARTRVEGQIKEYCGA